MRVVVCAKQARQFFTCTWRECIDYPISPISLERAKEARNDQSSFVPTVRLVCILADGPLMRQYVAQDR